MSYTRKSTILCIDNFKEKALYFDRVLPLNMGRMRGDKDAGDILIGYPEEIPSAALSHLIDGVEGNTNNYSHTNRIMGLITEHWTDFAKSVAPYAHLYAPNPNSQEIHDPKVEHKKLLKIWTAINFD